MVGLPGGVDSPLFPLLQASAAAVAACIFRAGVGALQAAGALRKCCAGGQFKWHEAVLQVLGQLRALAWKESNNTPWAWVERASWV